MEKYLYTAIFCLIMAGMQYYLHHDAHIASFLLAMAISQFIVAAVYGLAMCLFK